MITQIGGSVARKLKGEMQTAFTDENIDYTVGLQVVDPFQGYVYENEEYFPDPQAVPFETQFFPDELAAGKWKKQKKWATKRDVKDVTDSVNNLHTKRDAIEWRAGLKVTDPLHLYSYDGKEYLPNKDSVPFTTGQTFADDIILGRFAADVLLSEENLGKQKVLSKGSTNARSLEDRFSDVVNVKDFGAVGDGVTDDTDAIKKALATGKSVKLPEGVYAHTGIVIPAGSIVKGSSRTSSTLKALTEGSVVEFTAWGHGASLFDLRIDGGGVANVGVDVVSVFRTAIHRVDIVNCKVKGLSIRENTYFASYKDLHIDHCATGLSINPKSDYSSTHATSNDNLFENITINHFSVRAMDMKDAAGNTFTNIDLEQSLAGAIECLRIDHCTNNKFTALWFEAGIGLTSMQRLVFINDSNHGVYTRANTFDSCYFVCGSDSVEDVTYGVLLGSSYGTSFTNCNFIRHKAGVHGGSGTKGVTIAPDCTFLSSITGSKALSGVLDPQVKGVEYKTITISAETPSPTLTFKEKKYNDSYTHVDVQYSVSKFTGVSASDTHVYSYKYDNRVQFFSSRVNGTLEVDVKITYLNKA